MDKLLLSALVVSGLCAVPSAAERQYHVVYELKNWTEAQRHCRENYKDLATIRDPQDLETLKRTVDSSKMAASIPRAWIGLYDDLDSWRWSLTDSSFNKPGETEFRRWRSGEPDNGSGDEHCALMGPDGTWADYRCENTGGWSVCLDVRGPQRFVFNDNYMNWPEAQSYCREHHTDLAMVRNLEENQMVLDVAPRGGWIGLFRDGWKWSDGSDSSFKNWKPLEPRGASEGCVSADLSANGRWETLRCDDLSAIICFSDVVPVAKRVVKVRLQKSSSLDLNDPVVMEGLLKQLKQKLKDQGLNDDVKLSWKKQADGKVFHQEEKKTRKKGRDEL